MCVWPSFRWTIHTCLLYSTGALCLPLPFVLSQEAARALGAAAFNDHVAQEVNRCKGIPTIIAVCQSRHALCARFGAFALGNIALNDTNKRVILHAGGPDILVKLQAHQDQKVRDQAAHVMKVLGDLATPEEIDSLRKGFDVHGLLRLVEVCGSGGVV